VLGEPDGGVVAAAFGVFEPGLIVQLYDAARATAGLADIRAAREAGAVTALAGLPWPTDELGRLWHACSMLRELRGDSHLAAFVAAGLTGLEANILTELRVGWPLH